MLRFYIVVFITIVIGILFSGCSHNGLLIAKGTYFSLDQTGFRYVNGTVLNDLSRENSKLKVTVSDTANIAQQSDNSAEGSLTVNRKNGKQITGYLRDLAKESPDAVIEYLDGNTEKEEKKDNSATK